MHDLIGVIWSQIAYESGHGLEQDHADAMKWYRRAADQGYAVAQFNLGLMYENGRGVQQDEFEALESCARPKNLCVFPPVENAARQLS
jgi:hypothetical protein